jgi:hypothetical protein
MAKPGGRVEKGQSLRSAFSARAWNRAQDAADIVLGARPGLTAEAGQPQQFQVVVPCNLVNTASAGTPTVDARIGHWVNVYAMGAARPTNTAATEFSRPEITSLTGQLTIAATLIASINPAMYGVIVGGAYLPKAGETGFVDLCIFGPAVAFVVKRASDGNGPYRLGPPRLRDNADTVERLRGVMERNNCGEHLCINSDGGANYGTGGVNLQYSLVMVNG